MTKHGRPERRNTQNHPPEVQPGFEKDVLWWCVWRAVPRQVKRRRGLFAATAQRIRNPLAPTTGRQSRDGPENTPPQGGPTPMPRVPFNPSGCPEHRPKHRPEHQPPSETKSNRTTTHRPTAALATGGFVLECPGLSCRRNRIFHGLPWHHDPQFSPVRHARSAWTLAINSCSASKSSTR
jgi:hypothetical protein